MEKPGLGQTGPEIFFSFISIEKILFYFPFDLHKPLVSCKVRPLDQSLWRCLDLCGKVVCIHGLFLYECGKQPFFILRQFHDPHAPILSAAASIFSRKSFKNTTTRSAVSFLHCPQVISPCMHFCRIRESSESSVTMWKRLRR